MNCEIVQSQLLDLVGGSLQADAAAPLRAHVDGCAACRAQAARISGGMRLAKALPVEAVPRHVHDAVMARVRAGRAPAARQVGAVGGTQAPGAEASNGFSRFMAWLSGFVLGPQVAMAMVLMLMVGVGLYYLPGIRQSPQVPGGAIVNADPGDEAGPSAALEPAAPLDLRIDARTNRLQPAAEVMPERTPARPASTGAMAVEDTLAALLPAAPPAVALIPGAVTAAPALPPPDANDELTAALAQEASRSVVSLRAEPSLPDALGGGGAGALAAAEERADATEGVGGVRTRASDSASAGIPAPSPVAQTTPALDREAAAPMARLDTEVASRRAVSPARLAPSGVGAMPSATSASPSAPVPAAAPAPSTTTPAALHAAARGQSRAGAIRPAIAGYEALLSGHPSYDRAPEAMLELAELYRRVGDPTRARSWLARAERSPTYAARARLARTQLDEQAPARSAAPAAAASSAAE